MADLLGARKLRLSSPSAVLNFPIETLYDSAVPASKDTVWLLLQYGAQSHLLTPISEPPSPRILPLWLRSAPRSLPRCLTSSTNLPCGSRPLSVLRASSKGFCKFYGHGIPDIFRRRKRHTRSSSILGRKSIPWRSSKISMVSHPSNSSSSLFDSRTHRAYSGESHLLQLPPQLSALHQSPSPREEETPRRSPHRWRRQETGIEAPALAARWFLHLTWKGGHSNDDNPKRRARRPPSRTTCSWVLQPEKRPSGTTNKRIRSLGCSTSPPSRLPPRLATALAAPAETTIPELAQSFTAARSSTPGRRFRQEDFVRQQCGQREHSDSLPTEPA